MYGLYDFTNLATLKGWTLEMAIVDTLWGCTICAAAASVGLHVARRLAVGDNT